MVAKKYLRRRLVTLAMAAVSAVAIEWDETTYSSSFEVPYTAVVGEIITIVIDQGERASIDFTADDQSSHFAVSYRQCSSDTPQPLQIQYSSKLAYEPFIGGCLYAENELAEIGTSGCTFWQYNPSETYQTSGTMYENEELLDPGRVRFENQGDGNATVDVVMFSAEVTVPAGLVDQSVWIEDGFVKKDNIINTSVNVFFNNDDSYCDTYGCTVSGWVNDYIEGKDSLSLCEVQATGEEFYSDVDFDTWIPLTFELPEDDDFYVTLILSAREHRLANITEMETYGLNEVVVFQTDTTQEDSSARIFAGLSLVTLSWLIIVNTFFATFGTGGVHHGQKPIPALGW